MDGKFLSSNEWIVEDYAGFCQIEGAPFDKVHENGLSFYELIVVQMIWADEIYFSKIVDILISYLLDLIACAYRHDQNLIPSKARFDLSFVRKFRSINDAVRGSALAELERLSRSGFSELLNEAKRVASCELSENAESKLRQIVKLRNEIVHKQGSYAEIIDSMYKKKRRKKKNLFRHKPNDTAHAEVVACQIVGTFEIAVIKLGIEVAATKTQIFKNTDIL